MRRQVTYAALHDVFFVPGLGQMPNTLPPQNKTLKNLKLFLEDSGQLTLEWEEAGYLKEFTIGAATVKGALGVAKKLEEPKAEQAATKK